MDNIEAKAPWGETLSYWNEVVEACNLTSYGIERAYGFCASQVKKWLDGDVIPSKKSRAKMDGVLEML